MFLWHGTFRLLTYILSTLLIIITHLINHQSGPHGSSRDEIMRHCDMMRRWSDMMQWCDYAMMRWCDDAMMRWCDDAWYALSSCTIYIYVCICVWTCLRIKNKWSVNLCYLFGRDIFQLSLVDLMRYLSSWTRCEVFLAVELGYSLFDVAALIGREESRNKHTRWSI